MRARRHIGVVARPAQAVQPLFNWLVLLSGGCWGCGAELQQAQRKTPSHPPNLVALLVP
jgi:hypothetical protein